MHRIARLAVLLLVASFIPGCGAPPSRNLSNFPNIDMVRGRNATQPNADLNLTATLTEWSETPTPTSTLAVPSQLHATTITTASIGLAWDAVTSTEAVSYTVASNRFPDIVTAATAYTLTGLLPRTTFAITITAQDAGGRTSPPTIPLTVSTDRSVIFPQPRHLRVTSVATSSIALAWDAVPAADVLTYTIISATAASSAAPITTTADTAITITNLLPRTTYVFSVTAEDATRNESPSSDVLTATTRPDDGLPADPTAVASPTDPTAASDIARDTAFLYTGPDALQTGVVTGTITITQVAILRGHVVDAQGMPLSGVTIAVHGHAEYGHTLTRLDGKFDIAVNGGSSLTLDYTRPDRIAVQRQQYVPWRDYMSLPDVVMLPLDQAVTAVTLPFTDTQVVQSSIVSDTSGMRRATLIIPAGITATMVLSNGARLALTTLHIRATEYTVGQNGPNTMPGALPPSSAYTYALEYSVDEARAIDATTVQFSGRIFHYVEDFLDFPVGTLVPTGAYDRQQTAWIPSENGQVIAIIGMTDDRVDLDTDGDGLIDNGAAIGVTADERQQLARIYTVGQHLWRVPMTHFTPWDCNWPFGLPPDAMPPSQPPPLLDGPHDTPCYISGSIIGCQTQSLGESAPVAGTPYHLYYFSNRMPGDTSAARMTIPLSGAHVQPSLAHIDLEIHIAGRTFTSSFPPVANQQTSFVWDGKDAYGRTLQGSTPATVRLGYAYAGVYLDPANRASTLANLFARYSSNGQSISASQTRQEILLWQERTVSLSIWNTRGKGLGGWTVDIHHSYDPTGQVLHFGNGDQRSAESLQPIITAIAGNGRAPFSGDGGLATQAGLFSPSGLAFGPDGSIYIADAGHDRIRRVDSAGRITTIAGTGQVCTLWANPNCGDGGPANKAALNSPGPLALGPDGSLYIIEHNNSRVRRIDTQGIITTVIGTGQGCPSAIALCGDEGPAVQANLSVPKGIALGPDGSLYLADPNLNRIRKVGPDGIISTIVGTGEFGSKGDGGPAARAQLRGPRDVAVGPDGSLYIVETNQPYIRRITPDGIIRTIVGTGQVCSPTTDPCGDGGPATQAKLFGPASITVSADGTLYIADLSASRVRAVGSDGRIRTVAGTGIGGDSGNGGPAVQATLFASLVAVGPNGSLYVADSGHNRVHRIALPLPQTGADTFGIAAQDGSELYVFDAAGRHQRTLDALTGAVRYQFDYDQAHLLRAIVDGDGNTTVIERDDEGNPVAIVAPDKQRMRLHVDDAGYLDQITDPLGTTTQLTYTIDGLLTRLVDPSGGIHRFAYDIQGKLVRDDDPQGMTTTLSRIVGTNSYTVTLSTITGYTTTHKVERLPLGGTRETRIDPAGLTTETRVGADQRTDLVMPDGTAISTVVGPDTRWAMQAPGSIAQTMRLPSGLAATRNITYAVTITDPANLLSVAQVSAGLQLNGQPYLATYDAQKHTWKLITPERRTFTRMIDALGRPIFEQVGGLAPIQSIYDTRGRLTTIMQGMGSDARTIVLTYDADGYLESLTDPLGRIIRFKRDVLGHILQQQRSDGGTIDFQYDTNGNITALTPPGKAAHQWEYAPDGLLESYTPPRVGDGSSPAHYHYNASGQLTKIVRSDGRMVDISYDQAGRTGTVTFSRGVLSISYNPKTGHPTKLAAPDGIDLNFTYDGSLLTSTRLSGPVSGTVAWTYDGALRITSTSVNGGETIPLRYDRDGLLTHAGSLTVQRELQTGLPLSTQLGKVSDSIAYNAFAEPTSYQVTIDNAMLYASRYIRDSNGRIVAQTETTGGITSDYAYSYDLAGRLKTIQRDGTTTASYSYDQNGNRLTANDGGGTVSMTYDAQDRLLTAGDRVYHYTAGGELQSRTVGSQTTSYTYDDLGNLTAVMLPSGVQLTYLIDGQNRRVGKRENGTLIQGFLYDGQGRIAAELDMNSRVVGRFIYGSRENIPDYLLRNGIAYRIISDRLGSPRFVINTTTGDIVQQMDFDAFGKVLHDTNPGFQPFGFAGGLYDRDTHLTRFGARDYDAEVGRWITKDPLWFQGGDTNLYGYVLNDPINLLDPSGHFPQLPEWVREITQMGVLIYKLFTVSPQSLPPKQPMPTEPAPPLPPGREPPVGPKGPGSGPRSSEPGGPRLPRGPFGGPPSGALTTPFIIINLDNILCPVDPRRCACLS